MSLWKCVVLQPAGNFNFNRAIGRKKSGLYANEWKLGVLILLQSLNLLLPDSFTATYSFESAVHTVGFCLVCRLRRHRRPNGFTEVRHRRNQAFQSIATRTKPEVRCCGPRNLPLSLSLVFTDQLVTVAPAAQAIQVRKICDDQNKCSIHTLAGSSSSEIPYLFSLTFSVLAGRVMRDPNRISKGSTFVAFSTPEEASRAAQFAKMRPIAITPQVGTCMPMYPPGGPSLGQQKFYGQPLPTLLPPQQYALILLLLLTLLHHHLDFMCRSGFGYQQQLVPGMRPGGHICQISLCHRGQRPGGRRGGSGPMQQGQQPVPMMQQQGRGGGIRRSTPLLRRTGSVAAAARRRELPDAPGEEVAVRERRRRGVAGHCPTPPDLLASSELSSTASLGLFGCQSSVLFCSVLASDLPINLFLFLPDTQTPSQTLTCPPARLCNAHQHSPTSRSSHRRRKSGPPAYLFLQINFCAKILLLTALRLNFGESVTIRHKIDNQRLNPASWEHRTSPETAPPPPPPQIPYVHLLSPHISSIFPFYRLLPLIWITYEKGAHMVDALMGRIYRGERGIS
nr:polyadenylate-binding protein 2-like [Ipomoea batatas]